MRISNPRKLTKTYMDDPSRGFEQLKVLIVMWLLYNEEHSALFLDASDSRRLEKQGRTRRRKTRKARGPCLKCALEWWRDSGQMLSQSCLPMKHVPVACRIKAGTGLDPRTRVSPTPHSMSWAQRQKVKPPRLKMAQHDKATFYGSQGQRKRMCQHWSQNVSAVMKWFLPAYVWHFHSSNARFTWIHLKSIDYKRCQRDWLTRKM